MLAAACGKDSQQQIREEIPEGTDVVKEYFSNGKVKTEITAINGLREGPTRNYDREGRLLSEVNYTNNQKEGMATNYYAETGKISSTLEYKAGIKQGDERYYYENGQVYRISPYVNGLIEGIQKLYYENGKPLAEVPYKGGFAGTGAKEYMPDGSLVTDYPEITIRKENHMKDANKILLIIYLSNRDSRVKFYSGDLLDGKFLHKDILQLATQEGMTQIDFNIAPGSTIRKTIHLVASYKSPRRSPIILTKSYSFQVSNDF
jgi:antitoxin component YwqK of YwqJK toxin-antitoxin module